MSTITELSNVEYPKLWVLDAESLTGPTNTGEKSFFLLSFKVGDQFGSTQMKSRVIGSVGSVAPEVINCSMWNGAQWVRMGYSESAGDQVDFTGQLAYADAYVDADGFSHLLVATANAELPITLNYVSLEFNDLGQDGIYSKSRIKTSSRRQVTKGILAGVTNEWLMGVQLKAYHPSENSIWKAASYSDYWPFVNRCHFYSPEIAGDQSLLWHTSFGNRVPGGGVLMPESPSGYNYAPLELPWMADHFSVNQIQCGEEDAPGHADCVERRKNFYRSCRIYEPDPEIESAESVEEGGEELVKITFKTRLHHAASAPSSIPRDVYKWDVNALRREATTIRTTENALREYLVEQTLKINATADGPGNNAYNSNIQSIPDNPYGSVYPTFYFVKLIPSPYEDGNDRQDAWDTPVRHDPFTMMELYLRAMCEGYVDGRTSGEYACLHDTTSIFDYSFEALCKDAFGDRWFTLLPTEVRPDNPQGFGPLPNTTCRHEIFNQFSAAINRLTRVRVMLPMKLEWQSKHAYATKYVQAFNADGTPASCGSSTGPIYYDGTPSDAQVVWDDNWIEAGNPLQSYFTATLEPDCNNGLWALRTDRLSTRIRWQPIDPDSIYAIPESWRDMIYENATMLVKYGDENTRNGIMLQTIEKVRVDDARDADGCGLSGQESYGYWQAKPGYWKFPVETTYVSGVCELFPTVVNAAAFDKPNSFARGRANDGTACLIGPTNFTIFTPIIDTASMIEVPLV